MCRAHPSPSSGSSSPPRPQPVSAPQPVAHMGVVSGPSIDLGVGRRRVTRNDVSLFHALVSGADQTIEELGDEQHAGAGATTTTSTREARSSLSMRRSPPSLGERFRATVVACADRAEAYCQSLTIKVGRLELPGWVRSFGGGKRSERRTTHLRIESTQAGVIWRTVDGASRFAENGKMTTMRRAA